MFSEKGVCLLTIESASPADSGLYLCSAHNIGGTEASECTVTVKAKAKPKAKQDVKAKDVKKPG